MKRIVLISLALAALPLSACTTRSAATPAYTPTAATPRYEEPVSNGTVYDVQRRLSELGYYRGPIDGVWGGETRTALERFQANRRLAVTGDLNEATVNAMGLDSRRVLGRNYVSPPAPSYERPVATVGPVTTRAVQERLRHIGFYHGPIDGVWGQETRLAMEQFQHQRGLRITGTPTRQAMNALGLRSESFMSGSSLPPPSAADELNREEAYRQWR
jgi:peptidoglycan hydrolase-like protein with peptidoglycan-binding domain